MKKYNQIYKPTQTPQSQPIPGSAQQKNNAGGYAWKVDIWTQLERFLILGVSGSTYYQTEKELTLQNADSVRACIDEDGIRVVNRVVEISDQGLAPKNDPALFVLALCAAFGNESTRKAALANLSAVARTGTHLFTFVEYVTSFRGWGRALRRAVAAWYTEKSPDKLAYQLVKYRQRNGWSHRDLLRLSHPEPKSESQNKLFRWVTKNEWSSDYAQQDKNLSIIQGYELLNNMVRRGTRPQDISRETKPGYIRAYRLPREAVPTELLTDPDIWYALLDNMPLTALVRNLGNLSKVGLLLPGKWAVIEQVSEMLTNEDHLHKARVHPIQILAALITYQQGHGSRGHGTWQVVPQIVDALNSAFHMSFKHVEPTGKRYLLGVDVSGSMGWGNVSGIPGMTPAMGAAALAMTLARTEPKSYAFGFADKFRDLGITPQMSLQQVMHQTNVNNFGSTDCAAPMIWAMQNKVEADVFVILTDNETWSGNVHPSQALAQYRKQTGINAKLAVIAMEAGQFSIADPSDAGMMDFVGFSADTPAALAAFAKL